MNRRHPPAPEQEIGPASSPLVFDLDGTLLRGDCLWEALFWAASRKPSLLPRALIALVAGGRPGLKIYLAEHCQVLRERDIQKNAITVQFLEEQRRLGRRCVLATASPLKWAEEANSAFGGAFEQVIATERDNMKAERKAKTLTDLYGQGGFDYVGDSTADVPVWKAARKGYLAGGSPSAAEAAKRAGCRLEHLEPERKPNWSGALRTHQWSKNLLVVVPLFAAHKLPDVGAVLATLVTLVAFCAVASGNYILNDLWDAPNDRKHPTKRNRPVAKGSLGGAESVGLAAGMLALGFFAALVVSGPVFAILLLYLGVATVYSHWGKRIPILDALILSALYCLRLGAGGSAAEAPLSFWLLSASMFLFFSLALGKRDAELNSHQKADGRGYQAADRASISGLGAASAVGAAFMLCLYIQSSEANTYYGHHPLLWVLPAGCLYWAGRFWLVCGRGQMNEDPIVWAAGDRATQICAGVVFAALAAAHLLTVY